MWQKQQQLRFLSLFYFSKMISAFVTNIMARSIYQVENLFISLRVFSESSKSCNFSTVLILLLLTIACAAIFTTDKQLVSIAFAWVTGDVSFCQILKQKFEHETVHLFCDKTRCFSQSECSLYENFIIKCNTGSYFLRSLDLMCTNLTLLWNNK